MAAPRRETGESAAAAVIIVAGAGGRGGPPRVASACPRVVQAPITMEQSAEKALGPMTQTPAAALAAVRSSQADKET